jgi:glycosyltransferase involved in cell wall biosynthesis
VAFPTRENLPSPPADRIGWPWSDNYLPLGAPCPDTAIWPRISIVTPSFNQGQFLEETIRSVLLQGYPNLEYLVIDGGSHDNSREILQKYSSFLSYWHSRGDEGQADAINQGLRMATGDIVAWINSDDYYLPGVFERIADQFVQKDIQIIYGRAVFVDEGGKFIEEYPAEPLPLDWRRFRYWRGWPIPQPTVFMHRGLLEQFGFLDPSLHYALDYDLLIRLSCHIKLDFLDVLMANYRIHSHSKTGNWVDSQELFYLENVCVNRRYAPWYLPGNWRLWFEWLFHFLIWQSKKRIRSFVKWRK